MSFPQKKTITVWFYFDFSKKQPCKLKLASETTSSNPLSVLALRSFRSWKARKHVPAVDTGTLSIGAICCATRGSWDSLAWERQGSWLWILPLEKGNSIALMMVGTWRRGNVWWCHQQEKKFTHGWCNYMNKLPRVFLMDLTQTRDQGKVIRNGTIPT